MIESSLYIDQNPTHYVDIGITKDKKHLIISSNTKEDSEIWITDRSTHTDLVLPKKLVARVKDVKTHVDHLRDFFVRITTFGSKNKNYKIQT
jgi:protease II